MIWIRYIGYVKTNMEDKIRILKKNEKANNSNINLREREERERGLELDHMNQTQTDPQIL